MREIKFTISNEELAKLNNSFDQEQLRDMIADEINN
jgi:butyrate kinase